MAANYDIVPRGDEIGQVSVRAFAERSAGKIRLICRGLHDLAKAPKATPIASSELAALVSLARLPEELLKRRSR